MTKRKYQMTRLNTGDYMCPSNDGLRLWRFTKQQGGDWYAMSCDMPTPEQWERFVAQVGTVGDIDDLLDWQEESYHYATRAEIVERAFDVVERKRRVKGEGDGLDDLRDLLRF